MTDQECEVTMTFSQSYATAQEAENAADSLTFTTGEGGITNISSQPGGKAKVEATLVCMFSQDGKLQFGTCLVHSLKSAGLPFPKSATQGCLYEARQATPARVQS